MDGPAGSDEPDGPDGPRDPGQTGTDPTDPVDTEGSVEQDADAGQAAAAATGVQPCEDRDLQVPGDPYSPPCVTFEGDNGGATSQGVTEDAIIISARTPDEQGFQDELANIAGADITDTQQHVRRTIAALVDYFNDRFEFYGRELSVEFYEGRGGGTEESMGRGHEKAQADALMVAEEIGAFAELNGATEPFGDALATNGVIAIGGLHFSEEWHTERAPYTWSSLTDCSRVALSSADWANTRLRGRDAQYAGEPVLPVFLTARATEQDYHPEWIITGPGFTDQDIVGQLMDQEQWSRAFGISYNAAAQPQEASLGYNAYKQVRDDEPAFAVGTIYYSLYLLALGIHGAGPELTPETFEQGMFDYPGGEGPAGSWGFGPGNYIAPEDYREIYWDPEEVSPFNNEPGSYVETDPGVRHAPGEVPEGGPRVPW